MLARLLIGLFCLSVLSSCAVKATGCVLKSCQDFATVIEDVEVEK